MSLSIALGFLISPCRIKHRSTSDPTKEDVCLSYVPVQLLCPCMWFATAQACNRTDQRSPRSQTPRPRCTPTHPRPSLRAPTASIMFALTRSERQAASPGHHFKFSFPTELQQNHVNSNTSGGRSFPCRFIRKLSSSPSLNLHHHQSESTSEYECSRASARGPSTPHRSPAALSQPAASIHIIYAISTSHCGPVSV